MSSIIWELNELTKGTHLEEDHGQDRWNCKLLYPDLANATGVLKQLMPEGSAELDREEIRKVASRVTKIWAKRPGVEKVTVKALIRDYDLPNAKYAQDQVTYYARVSLHEPWSQDQFMS